MTIDIDRVPWSTHSDTLRDIRKAVFIDEQGVAQDLEWDEHDESDSTIHLLAHDDERPIGCARVLLSGSDPGKITRLAVRKENRRQGVGATLLQTASDLVFETADDAYLHAQLASLPFYQKYGFVAEGDVFVEAGIDHLEMHLRRDCAESLIKLYRTRVLRLDSADHFSRHLDQVVRCGRRKIDILSTVLEREIYGRDSVVEALSKFLRDDPHATLRILVEDSSLLPKLRHPLVDLARRLSSKADIRRIVAGSDPIENAFAIVDEKSLLFFNDEAHFLGFVNYDDAPTARRFAEKFQHLWDHYSEQDPNLIEFII